MAYKVASLTGNQKLAKKLFGLGGNIARGFREVSKLQEDDITGTERATAYFNALNTLLSIASIFNGSLNDKDGVDLGELVKQIYESLSSQIYEIEKRVDVLSEKMEGKLNKIQKTSFRF